ncbi:MAG TPA: quinoprotein dehydrogenase-associated putative ABC transporter substrate-binding protein [Steroidobacteraceae bacterium]|nr:quinoprotein dehydrogenase-associated putative ABC transporter substrate-binding protein [Steroidobacteraceae bacterium]
MTRRADRLPLRWLACAVCCLSLLPPIHAAPVRPVLRVCADPNNLPFSNRDGAGLENALAQLLARDLGWDVSYAWWPQRRGFIRNTLKTGKCDVVLGLPAGFELAELTEPYYTSSYVFVTRAADRLDLRSLDDPRLLDMKIGLHTVGDDYAGVPPARELGRRGITSNVVGYSIYGDYSRPDPPRALIDAVARGDVDVAIAWGPLAGYFAGRAPVPLVVTTIEAVPDRAGEDPLSFSIAASRRRRAQARTAGRARSAARGGAAAARRVSRPAGGAGGGARAAGERDHHVRSCRTHLRHERTLR